MTSRSDGLCSCGCGQRTRLAPKTDRSKGWVKGQPLRYLKGHNRGPAHPQWKGGMGRANPAGHISVYAPEHPQAHNGRVLAHVLVASTALGKALPSNAVVHHVDGDPSNNEPANLVVCEDHAYHNLLHQRMRAKDACGHAGWLRCRRCKDYGSPESMGTSGGRAYHRECEARYQRERKSA